MDKKQEMHEYHKNILLENFRNGNIRGFSVEFYAKSNKIVLNDKGKTVYEMLINSNNKCYVTSFILTLLFDEFALAKGKVLFRGVANQPIEEHMKHGWLEVDDEVYDTTLHLIFKKTVYYELFDVKEVEYKMSCELKAEEKYQILLARSRNSIAS